MVKLVEDATRGVLVGATSLGPCGGELLGMLALAVHAEVLTERLRDMVHEYPTFHRAVGTAVRSLDHARAASKGIWTVELVCVDR